MYPGYIILASKVRGIIAELMYYWEGSLRSELHIHQETPLSVNKMQILASHSGKKKSLSSQSVTPNIPQPQVTGAWNQAFILKVP